MKRSWKVFVFLFLILSFPGLAFSQPVYKLFRLIEWKNATEKDSQYRPLTRKYAPLDPEPYGIMTFWGHKVRSEMIWLSNIRLFKDRLQCSMTFEKNDWPMDDTWDPIWEKEVSFELGVPYFFESQILERKFRAMLVLLKEEK